MIKLLKSFFSFFGKKDTIQNENEVGSDFYIKVICKGRKKLDSELFDKNSDSYLFREN
jgi:hypothetical protein